MLNNTEGLLQNTAFVLSAFPFSALQQGKYVGASFRVKTMNPVFRHLGGTAMCADPNQRIVLKLASSFHVRSPRPLSGA